MEQNELELCASRYLQEHHIEQVSPDSTQPNNHFYGSEQEQKILTERTDTSNGFSFGVCGKGKAIQGVSGSGDTIVMEV